MSKEDKTYEYRSEYGGKFLLSPWINMYANSDNLALGFIHYDVEEGCWEPFCCATINIIPLAYLEAAIDTNDNGFRFLDFLEANGFGQRTSFSVGSGYCQYPVFKFDEARLQEIDPKTFAEYRKAYRMDKQPLAEKVAQAQDKSGADKKNHSVRRPER